MRPLGNRINKWLCKHKNQCSATTTLLSIFNPSENLSYELETIKELEYYVMFRRPLYKCSQNLDPYSSVQNISNCMLYTLYVNCFFIFIQSVDYLRHPSSRPWQCLNREYRAAASVLPFQLSCLSHSLSAFFICHSTSSLAPFLALCHSPDFSFSSSSFIYFVNHSHCTNSLPPSGGRGISLSQ